MNWQETLVDELIYWQNKHRQLVDKVIDWHSQLKLVTEDMDMDLLEGVYNYIRRLDDLRDEMQHELDNSRYRNRQSGRNKDTPGSNKEPDKQ